MIDWHHEILSHLEKLPQEAQEEAATYIEALMEALEREAFSRGYIKQLPQTEPTSEVWHDPAGSWSDLPDTLLENLDDLRHSNSPTPPVDSL